MSKLIKLSFLFAIVALFMTSCNNDNVLQDNDVTPEPPVVTQNQQQINSLVTSDSAGCYEIVFPITFIMDDGTSETVASEADLDGIFNAPPFPVNLGFPVNLTDPVTGANVTANDEAELGAFLAECDLGGGPGTGGGVCDSVDLTFGFIGCYDLDYPVSFVLVDGTTATANSVDDLNTIFDPTNPPVDFAYPLNLVNIDTGVSETANDESELNDLLLLCGFGGGGPGTGGGGGICDSTNFDLGFIGCYDLVYPVSFVLVDGTTATANSVDDLATIFTSSNPPVDFAYPLSLVNIITGESATANDETELGDLLISCDSIGSGGGGGGSGGGGSWGQSIVYPMTIITIVPDTTGFVGCYDFEYPVSVVDVDGNVLTASDDDSMMTTVFGNVEIVDFVYPINVTDTNTGQTLTANNEGDVVTLLNDCN